MYGISVLYAGKRSNCTRWVWTCRIPRAQTARRLRWRSTCWKCRRRSWRGALGTFGATTQTRSGSFWGGFSAPTSRSPWTICVVSFLILLSIYMCGSHSLMVIIYSFCPHVLIVVSYLWGTACSGHGLFVVCVCWWSWFFCLVRVFSCSWSIWCERFADGHDSPMWSSITDNHDFLFGDDYDPFA